MAEELTIEMLVNAILDAQSREEWEALIDRFGPRIMGDLSLIKQFGERISRFRLAGQPVAAEKLIRWDKDVMRKAGEHYQLKQKLLNARSEQELQRILKQNRRSIGPELVHSALYEIPHLIGGNSPFPLTIATEMAKRILRVNLKISEFLQDDHLCADCLKERSSVYIGEGNPGAAIADLQRAAVLYEKANDPIEAGRCLGIIGGLLRKHNKLQEGLNHLLQAASLFLDNGGDKYMGITYQEIAIVYQEQGDLGKALHYFEQALDYRLACEQWPEAVNLLVLLCARYLSKGDTDKAFPHCQRLIDLYLATPGKQSLPPISSDVVDLIRQVATQLTAEIHTEAFFTLGEAASHSSLTSRLTHYTAFIDRRKLEAAVEWHALALRADPLAPSQEGQAYLALADGSLSLIQGDLDRAAERAEAGIRFFETRLAYEQVLAALGVLAEAEHRRGRLEAAIGWAERGLQLSREHEDSQSIATWLTSLGVYLRDKARPDQAFVYLEEAIQVSKAGTARTDRASEGSAYGMLGKVYRDLGDLDNSFHATMSSLRIARYLGHKRGEACGLVDLGILCGMLRERRFGEPPAEKVAEILKQILTEGLQQPAEAVSLERNGRPLEALIVGIGVRLLEKALEELEAIDDRLGRAQALSCLSNFLDEPEDRLNVLQEVLAQTRTLGDQLGEAVTLGNLGQAYWSLGKDEDARRHFEQSLDIARSSGFFESGYHTALDLGRFHEAAGNLAPAERYYTESVNLIEAARENVPLSDLYRTGFVRKKAEAYSRLITLMLAKEANDQAFELVQRAKSRALIEITATAHIEPSAPRVGRFAELLERESKNLEGLRRARYLPNSKLESPVPGALASQYSMELDTIYEEMESYDPDYVSLRSGLPATRSRVQMWLNAQKRPILLVEYFLSDTQLTLFFLRANWDHVKVHIERLTPSDLWIRYRDFWREVVRYRNLGSASWTMLSRHLVDPLEEHLQAGDLVYLIPHHLLHGVPIHSLPLRGKPLIAHHPVAYAPAAGLLPACQSPGKGTDRLDSCVAFGVVFEAEARDLAQLFGVEPIISQDLTRATVNQMCQGRDVCHFSCHGYFNPADPMSSGLLIRDIDTQGVRDREAILTARDIMSMRFQSELVCLSACQTGLSQVSEGDELLGLIRAFLYAGASSIVASLWQVDAKTTRDLMIAFYTSLREEYRRRGTFDKAGALQQAQLEMMQRQGVRRSFFWAPFILVGDWS